MKSIFENARRYFAALCKLKMHILPFIRIDFPLKFAYFLKIMNFF